jgi:hypothetical protein
MLLAPGLSVHAFAIYGLLADDGAIDLVGLAIDLHRPSHEAPRVGRRPGSPATVLVEGGGHGEQGELLGAGGADGQRLPGSGTPGTTRAHLEPVDAQRPAGAPAITHTDAAVTFALDDRALAPPPARTVAPADTVTGRQAQGRQLRSPGRCHRAEGTAD